MDGYLCRMTTRPVEIKRNDEGEPTHFFGYGAVFYDGTERTEFQLFDDVHERIMPGAFDDMEMDLRSTFNHDPNILLGRQSAGTLEVGTDKTGLWYKTQYNPKDPDHVRVMEKLQRGDIDGSSFWFKVTDDEKRSDGKGGVIWELRKLTARELGPVTFQAYQGTTAQMRSADGIDPARAEIDGWLKRQQDKKANDLEYAKTVVRSLE